MSREAGGHMNKIILMGRLTRDPEVSYSNADNSIAITRFNLAVDRRFKSAGDSTEADFFNCIAFGKQAEFVEKYLKKGTKILLTGRIQNNNYTNKEGQKVYSMQIIRKKWSSQKARVHQATITIPRINVHDRRRKRADFIPSRMA